MTGGGGSVGDDHGALARGHGLKDLRHVFVFEADAAHGLLLADGIGLDGAVDAIRLLAHGVAVGADEANPELAEGVFGVVGLDNALAAGAVIHWILNLFLGFDEPAAL